MTLDVRWIWAFIDGPVPTAEAQWAFWTAASRSSRDPRRGDHDEFATLLPEHGDAWLKLQRVDGPGGIHLDLDVPDPQVAAPMAAALGATVVADHGYVVMRSPGGFTFCLTTAEPRSHGHHRDGQPDLVDQVSLDIPAARFDTECAFWADLTGWTLHDSALREFRYLERAPGLPLRLLLQRVDDDRVAVTGHLDLACADRAAIVERLVGLGASVIGDGPRWTVLREPGGLVCCATDRDPRTGSLPDP